MRKLSAFNLAALVLGIAFLYLPIVILVVYSFNASRLVVVWGGWSTRWYAELAGDAPLLGAAFISLRVALVSASAATLLGTLAAVTLVRFGRFRGRLLFAAMIYAPLVMPEVITGLSMLLLFVAIAVDRGFWTVVIAHTTMAMCFVAVIVQARLVDFDMSLEEAAMDLGASPARTFMTVTLPLILPAIAASWMLAFALSLDDLVIASFTTGPGATTLPIRIYSEVRLGVSPEMNAVCSIMVAVVGVAVIAASLLTKLSAARGASGASVVNPGSRRAAGKCKTETTPARSPARRATSSAAPRPCPARANSSIRSGDRPAVFINSSVRCRNGRGSCRRSATRSAL